MAVQSERTEWRQEARPSHGIAGAWERKGREYNMNVIELIAGLVVVLVIPYLVNAIKSETLTGNAARWLAIVVSVLGGVVVGLVGGIPDTPQAWFSTVLAVVGGVQTAYSAFKSVGVTSKWLDALLDLPVKAESAHAPVTAPTDADKDTHDGD